MIAPHPYFPGLNSLFGALNRHEDLFDAVERNAMYTASLDFNRPAERWAHAHNKPVVGNGDVHRLEQLDTTYTLVDAERDPAAICAAVAAGRVRLVTRPLTWGTAVRLVTGILASSFVLRPRSTQPAEATV